MSNEKTNQSLDIGAVADSARQLLRSYRLSGLQTLPKPKGQHEFDLGTSTSAAVGEADSVAEQRPTMASSAPPRAETPAQSPAGTGMFADPALDAYESSLLDGPERATQLQLIESEVSGCTKCSELASCRKNTVFGVGNASAQLCFLGEGPGADEDRQGEPFVGAAGQLLDRIIEACKMRREDVYILNTVKCRPPGNRNPAEDELANCWPYAVRQLEIIQPEFICCLGSVAARTLLQTKQSIGRMRGQFFKYRSSRVVVTYHPAYLLRNPSAKRQVWDDMKMLITAMGRSI